MVEKNPVGLVYMLEGDIGETSVNDLQAIRDVSGNWQTDIYFLSKLAWVFKKQENLRRSAYRKQLGKEGRPPKVRYLNDRIYSEEFYDVVASGRMKIGLLINSEGGEVRYLDKILKNLISIKAAGNEILVYVSDEACSAAAKIFEVADRRYALDDSYFMWHISSYCRNKYGDPVYLRDGQRRKDGFEAQQEMRDFRNFLRQNVDPKDLARILRQLNVIEKDPDNLDNIWQRQGHKLKEMGILNESFVHLYELRRHFAKEFQGVLDEVDFINEFFE